MSLDLWLVIVGLSLLANPLITRLTDKKKFITPSMIYLFGGVCLATLMPSEPYFSLGASKFQAKLAEHFTECVVILTLVSAGIKIDRPFDRLWWSSTWRMLGVTMLATIFATAWAGWYFMSLPITAALLLGAIMAPTDPVLAHDMQTGPPQQDSAEHHVRFTLTTEAGFNDGLAFPFTYLAIRFEKLGLSTETFWNWLAWDFFARILIGLAVGFVVGKILGKFVFGLLEEHQEDTMKQHFGIFIIGAMFFTYGACEWLSGYGFLAVFIAAVVGRTHERKSEYHRKTFKFLEQIEESLTSFLLLMLGTIIYQAGDALLAWPFWPLAFLLIFVFRPLSGLLATVNVNQTFRDRLAIAFLGVRGIGSFYYLAYASTQIKASWIDLLMHILLVTIVLSVIVHGASNPLLISAESAEKYS